MNAIDTNVLVRLLARDDVEQISVAEAFVKDGAWVSHLVLMEAIWVLDSVYELNAQSLAEALDQLLDHAQLSIQDPDVVRAAVEHYRKKPALGFSDCLMLEVARKAGNLPLGTFDRCLSKIEGTQLL